MNASKQSSSRPFSLYVHIPYCIKKCPYCDFNSYGVGNKSVDAESGYTDALIAELRTYAETSPWTGRPCSSIFFGGGTPSLFSPSSISRVLRAVEQHFLLTDSCEITLEANPGTIQEDLGKEKLAGFRELGVNRCSMGVQSFQTEKLKFLGRLHSAEDVFHAVENIRAAGFDNFNLDLIFGVNNEQLLDWDQELSTMLSIAPRHISAYGLTIEPGTEFARLYKTGNLPTTADETQADMFSLTQERLGGAGYEQYEISNYAKPDSRCRHNLSYWTGKDYLGIGAGAHSYHQDLGAEKFGKRWSNIPGPDHYLARIAEIGTAVQREEDLSEDSAKMEFFYLGLRTANGVDTAEYKKRFDIALDYEWILGAENLVKEGLLLKQASNYRLSPKGFLFANHVITELAP